MKFWFGIVTPDPGLRDGLSPAPMRHDVALFRRFAQGIPSKMVAPETISAPKGSRKLAALR
jgi:hypothetical protein